MELMRLQKFLSTAGFSSRRKAETFILEGRVSVNGVVITALGSKIDPQSDRVAVDGKPVTIEQPLIYIAINKPKGVVASCEQKNDRIVLDLIDIPERVYPVGRLDKDSCGLLLLTNDGRLHHRLSHPSFDHEKEYEVAVADPIPDGALKHMEKGLPMMGTKTRPARIKRLSPRRFRMVLQEGKNRQIRRMLRKVGHQVTDLKRIRVANIRLGNLAEGAWRYLSEREKEELLQNL
ncbi:MAG: pseudouridine synthase [Desulfobacterales bacterium]|nr:pseudouridine synthase [Desulfobacterales bacterium]